MCGICGKLDKKSLCNKCNIKLQKNAICKIEDYKNMSSCFKEHIYLFQYTGEIRDTILKYKFNEMSYIYRTFLEFIKNSENICAQIKKYDIIIPVPISKNRLNTRGYNQSALIAKVLAKELNIEYSEKVLIKIKDNKPQSEMKQDTRKNNVSGVYKVINKEKINNKKVLVVDDIFTTGSTADECARVLKDNNAESIGVFTLAKD